MHEPKMASLTLVFVVVVLLILLYNTDALEQQDSSTCYQRCGVHNIRHPFRLEDSPKECGDKRYTLSCHNKKHLILYYESFEKSYVVQSINYNNFTIRLLDFNLASYNDSIPNYYSLGLYNFSHSINASYLIHQYKNFSNILPKSMLYVSCPSRMNSTYSLGLMNQANSNLVRNLTRQLRNYFYVGGYHKSLLELGLEDGCHIESMYLTSWPIDEIVRGNNENISYMDIRHMVFYGFELSWIKSHCENGWFIVQQGMKKDGWFVDFDDHRQPRCVPSETLNFPALVVLYTLNFIGKLYFMLITVKHVLGVPCIIVLLIYKWKQKHVSMYNGIEDFLQSDNSIMPIRYSYRDIKKITEHFKTKLGNGGFGSVFKGQLRSGLLVAVKLLDKGKSNGQDFVNEIVTIGRIHHVNVVQLIGFCVEGSKRALIYEFMPNGSLEKYIFSHNEESYSLSREKLYVISLGVGRGIEYLHNGCNMKILHFDIKPHNILLDENFNPKVSDFGLARLCPIDKSIVSLTAARGTIGYMAPELFYRNVGRISYKADVYSFGMLLMEMANRRRNLNALAEKSSQIYFPFWVYDQLQDGREITVENDTNQEMKLAKRMMIVALWCIQTKPDDRPAMDKVLEMLEQEDEDLKIPNKPYLYPQDLPTENIRDHSTCNSWSSSGISTADSMKPT